MHLMSDLQRLRQFRCCRDGAGRDGFALNNGRRINDGAEIDGGGASIDTKL
jgi:hypothetical protein